MTLLNSSISPSTAIFISNVQYLLYLSLVSTRHLANQHITILTAVIVVHLIVIVNQLIANLCWQRVTRFPITPSCLFIIHLTSRLPLVEDTLYPLLVAETVEVGIWFIDHLILRFLPDVRLVAILRTCWDMSNGILHVIRIDKLLLQLLPLWGIRLQRE